MNIGELKKLLDQFGDDFEIGMVHSSYNGYEDVIIVDEEDIKLFLTESNTVVLYTRSYQASNLEIDYGGMTLEDLKSVSKNVEFAKLIEKWSKG